MEQQKQKLYLVMDDTGAPYKDGEYTPTLEEDLISLRIAQKYGIKFIPGSHLDRISKIMSKTPE